MRSRERPVRTTPARPTRRGLRRLLRDRRGVAALEAAMVTPPYLLFTMFLFQISMMLFWQEALDYATHSAARQIQIGAAQSQAATSSDFMTNIMCPMLSGLIVCDDVLIDIQHVSDFYSHADYTVSVPKDKDGKQTPRALPYCNGAPSQMMLVRAVYMSPAALTPFFGTVAWGSGKAVPIISTAAFVDEAFPPTGATTPCS